MALDMACQYPHRVVAVHRAINAVGRVNVFAFRQNLAVAAAKHGTSHQRVMLPYRHRGVTMIRIITDSCLVAAAKDILNDVGVGIVEVERIPGSALINRFQAVHDSRYGLQDWQ